MRLVAEFTAKSRWKCVRRAAIVAIVGAKAAFWQVDEASLKTPDQSGRSRCGPVPPIPTTANLRRVLML